MATCPPSYSEGHRSIEQVAQYWADAGGSTARLVVPVSIAWTESYPPGNIFSKSSVCALGLWQIMYFHADTYGISASALYDPLINAKIAVALSGNDRDWGAWDVAYAAGEGLTSRYTIGFPERGSVAYNVMPLVARTLGLPDPSGQSAGGGDGGISIPGISGVQTAPPTTSQPTTTPATPTQGRPNYPRFSAWGPVSEPPAQSYGYDNLRQWWGVDTVQLQGHYLALYNYLLDQLGG